MNAPLFDSWEIEKIEQKEGVDSFNKSSAQHLPYVYGSAIGIIDKFLLYNRIRAPLHKCHGRTLSCFSLHSNVLRGNKIENWIHTINIKVNGMGNLNKRVKLLTEYTEKLCIDLEHFWVFEHQTKIKPNHTNTNTHTLNRFYAFEQKFSDV